jgi:hypothetical protein
MIQVTAAAGGGVDLTADPPMVSVLLVIKDRQQGPLNSAWSFKCLRERDSISLQIDDSEFAEAPRMTHRTSQDLCALSQQFLIHGTGIRDICFEGTDTYALWCGQSSKS